jgi:surface polysaccharide O-acyltransferase-like enzyme
MQRRLDLDAIRIAAFLLLVLYHVGMYYVSWGWHIKSPQAGPTLEPAMLLTAPWRLSLLFVISGVAAAFLYDKAPAGFMRSRSSRLLLPLAFGVLVIVPPQSYLELLDSRYPGGFHDGYVAFWWRYLQGDASFCDDEGCLKLPTWNHLWFVAYLWVYTLVAWLLLRDGGHRVDRIGARLRSALAGVGLLLWPVAWLALARLVLVERFPSTHALGSDWYNHAQYLPLFLLGVLIARSEAVWTTFHGLRWPALVSAVAGYCFIAWYFCFSPFADGAQAPGALRGAQRVAWALLQWSAIVAIIGFARGIVVRDGPVLRYLREAVFPVYILHQTVIVIVAWNLRGLELRPLFEGPLLVIATFALCFLGFEFVRRVRWLRPLFGLSAGSVRAAAP